MKHVRFFASLLLCVLVATACQKEQDSWLDELEPGTAYMAIGTLHEGSRGFYITEDDSSTIYLQNVRTVTDSLIGKRIYIEFYKYNTEHAVAGYDATAYVTNTSRYVLTKPYFTIRTAAENDSIGNAPIDIQAAWITGQYVHVVFKYYGNGQKQHFINLVDNQYTPSAANGKINLEMRHNAYDEIPANSYYGVASFDISGLWPASGTTATLHIVYPNTSTTTRELDLKIRG